MTLKEYIENKEEILITENIGEQALMAVVGIPSAGLFAAWGTTLVLLAFSKGSKGVYNTFKKAFENFRYIKRDAFETFFQQQKNNPVIKQEIIKTAEKKREYADVLKDVYEGFDNNNYTQAKDAYDVLSKNYKNMTTVKQIIINEIAKKEGAPVNLPSPGNKSYKTIKMFLGIREAKAAAEAVRYSMNKAVQNIEEKEE